jgi:hypothetical protein
MATIDVDTATFDPTELQRRLDGRDADLRAEIRETMSRPELAPVVESSATGSARPATRTTCSTP